MHAYRTHNCAVAQKTSAKPSACPVDAPKARSRRRFVRRFARDHYGSTQIVADEDSPVLAILDGCELKASSPLMAK
jgi:aspartyl-tRNA synthetase